MRGKVPQYSRLDCSQRITPAHAGKSISVGQMCLNTRDHPRTCGEKIIVTPVLIVGLGSPPHMRGKVLGNIARVIGNGITPAHAGKRWFFPPIFVSCTDHPRTCGEKMAGYCRRIAFPGSPPHMRGKALQTNSGILSSGITPAHAGKSLTDEPFMSCV